MSENRVSDPNEDPSPIDPPGNTGPDPRASMDAPAGSDSETAIDPPGNTES